eukprot:TRINITY_DN10840_c0_g1_i1.p2 TRINITY_DN10840_c0_g1~~TRINITY_DN10840_c0_g1_i1.p2  ORF type:complete len:147 (+),score=37.65 TRINITY_DN10840_c0_g1_i1:96-536(+)
MVRAGHVVLAAFTSSHHGDLHGLTSDKLVGKLDPEIQKFLMREPDLKREWEEGVRSSMLLAKEMGPRDAKELKQALLNEVHEMNTVVRENPALLQQYSALAKSLHAQCSPAAAALLAASPPLPPSVALKRGASGARQRWQGFARFL